ncbi:hypothetical protein PMI09_00553 [Rhizobium sp. CF122]|nr:hypothetical protein PMI09_00553 [Rhizobium sp. CF122]
MPTSFPRQWARLKGRALHQYGAQVKLDRTDVPLSTVVLDYIACRSDTIAAKTIDAVYHVRQEAKAAGLYILPQSTFVSLPELGSPGCRRPAHAEICLPYLKSGSFPMSILAFH